MKRNRKIQLQELELAKEILESDYTLLAQLFHVFDLLLIFAVIDETTLHKLYKYELRDKTTLNLLIKLYTENDLVKSYINKLKILI